MYIFDQHSSFKTIVFRVIEKIRKCRGRIFPTQSQIFDSGNANGLPFFKCELAKSAPDKATDD